MELMDNAPFQFITQHTDNDLKRFLDFKHRTFNATDTLYFIEFFREHYSKYPSLESAFTNTLSFFHCPNSPIVPVSTLLPRLETPPANALICICGGWYDKTIRG
jgi:hypothetical protein